MEPEAVSMDSSAPADAADDAPITAVDDDPNVVSPDGDTIPEESETEESETDPHKRATSDGVLARTLKPSASAKALPKGVHPLQHLSSNKARMSQVFKYLNPAKSVMMNDRLKVQNDSQLKTYLKSIGTDEKVIFSDSIFVRRVDQDFLEEVMTGKETRNEPINVTCIVTNLSVLILPPMAEGFLICNLVDRYPVHQLLVACLPYRSKVGVTEEGEKKDGTNDYALRADDVVLHFRGLLNGNESLWLQTKPGDRSLLGEVISNAYECLMGNEPEMLSPDCSELVTWHINGMIGSQIRTMWKEAEQYADDEPPITKAGWLSLAKKPIPKKKDKRSSFKSPADLIKELVWEVRWFVLTDDKRLLHFEAPSAVAPFRLPAPPPPTTKRELTFYKPEVKFDFPMLDKKHAMKEVVLEAATLRTQHTLGRVEVIAYDSRKKKRFGSRKQTTWVMRALTDEEMTVARLQEMNLKIDMGEDERDFGGSCESSVDDLAGVVTSVAGEMEEDVHAGSLEETKQLDLRPTEQIPWTIAEWSSRISHLIWTLKDPELVSLLQTGPHVLVGPRRHFGSPNSGPNRPRVRADTIGPKNSIARGPPPGSPPNHILSNHHTHSTKTLAALDTSPGEEMRRSIHSLNVSKEKKRSTSTLPENVDEFQSEFPVTPKANDDDEADDDLQKSMMDQQKRNMQMQMQMQACAEEEEEKEKEKEKEKEDEDEDEDEGEKEEEEL